MRRNFRVHKPVNCLLDFLHVVGDARLFLEVRNQRGDDDILWFRGQHSVDWALKPKFYRPEFSAADEPETRNLFESRAIQLIQGRQPTDKWEWYFLMQHHGVPTRLLDWTENPLIALYFAVKNNLNNSEAAVWIVDPHWLNRQNSFLKSAGVEGPILPYWSEADEYLLELEAAYEGSSIRKKFPAAIEAPHVDSRLHAQASRFVVFGKSPDLSNMFDIKPSELGLAKVPISLNQIQKIQDDLAGLGIHAASVFPDIGGLGEYVCDEWKTR